MKILQSKSKGEAMPKFIQIFHANQLSTQQAKAVKGGTDFIIIDEVKDV